MRFQHDIPERQRQRAVRRIRREEALEPALSKPSFWDFVIGRIFAVADSHCICAVIFESICNGGGGVAVARRAAADEEQQKISSDFRIL